MTMIERVARAISAVVEAKWAYITEEEGLALARAALEAMWEPSVEMMEAAQKAFVFPSEGDRSSVSVKGCVDRAYAAMINKALEESKL